MNGKKKLYSNPGFVMKEVGVCALFEYYSAAYNSSNKNRQKNYWCIKSGGYSWPFTNLTFGTYFGAFQWTHYRF